MHLLAAEYFLVLVILYTFCSGADPGGEVDWVASHTPVKMMIFMIIIMYKYSPEFPILRILGFFC